MTPPNKRMQPTDLEKAILRWIADGSPLLAGPLARATIARRDHTGVGFYAYLSLDETAEWDHPHIGGPTIESPNLDMGGGSVLWLVNGTPSCLEVYAFGDTFPEDIDEFNLSSGPLPPAL